MAVNLIRGGGTFETTSPTETREIMGEVFAEQARERQADRAKKDMEVMLPFPGTASSVFLGPAEVAGMPDEGYVWSLKLVSVNFTAAGTMVAYKASSTADTRRPLGSVPAQPGVTYTTQSAPAFPATGVAVQNTTNQAYTVVLSAGGATITNVSVNGITVGTGAGTYVVPAYGSISVAYSVATPSWTWTATQTNVPGLTTATITWSSDAGRLRHSEGLYIVCTSNITQVYVRAWQVPSEMAAEIYD